MSSPKVHIPCSNEDHSKILHCDLCHLVMPCLDGAIVSYQLASKLTVEEIRQRLMKEK